MAHDERLNKYRRIVADASRARLESTRMFLDTTPHPQGALVGPAPQNIRAKHTALVVFIDENPRANFAHECRYRYYDPETQRFLYEERAQFPPWVNYVPKNYVPIDDPATPGRGENHHG
jgi:hypothetical protein